MRYGIYTTASFNGIRYTEIWCGFWNTKNIQITKGAIRILTNSKYNAHTEPLFKQHKILTVNDLFTLKIAKFYFKYCNGEVPDYLKAYRIVPQGHLHEYTTRNADRFRSNITSTQSAQKCLRNHLPKVLNQIPNTLLIKTRTHSYHNFSMRMKMHLIEQYSSQCSITNCYICRSHQ